MAGIPLFGKEYHDGRVRLVLDPQVGRFSLYYMTDVSQRKYEALFVEQDPRTTVLTVDYNDKLYRLGESAEFKISEGGTPQRPALIFESSFLKVTQEFSFIVTQGSSASNGIRIDFRLENKSWRRIPAGLRFLLDTKLGESTPIPFITDRREVGEELILTTKTDPDRYWVSGRTDELALMGSLSADVDRAPDRVHFANWKRLDEVPWSLDLVPGRKFNNPPYSIRDSAVAYYYDPARINRGGTLSFYLLLGAYHIQGFAAFKASTGLPPTEPVPTAANIASAGLPAAGTAVSAGTAGTPAENPQPAPERGILPNLNPAIIRSDYNALRDIISHIDSYLESGFQISEDELAGIEQDLARIQSRYAGSQETGEP
jgi:hypothetical protein